MRRNLVRRYALITLALTLAAFVAIVKTPPRLFLENSAFGSTSNSVHPTGHNRTQLVAFSLENTSVATASGSREHAAGKDNRKEYENFRDVEYTKPLWNVLSKRFLFSLWCVKTYSTFTWGRWTSLYSACMSSSIVWVLRQPRLFIKCSASTKVATSENKAA